MISIPFTSQIEPYFAIAETEAKKSPCVRRQYGAVIAYPNWKGDNDTPIFESSYNQRISPCCNDFCVRDRVDTRHGGSVEIGGEIHAETSLLLKRVPKGNAGYFILVGFEKGKQLYGSNVYPCHMCAVSLKFAGYSHIFIRESKSDIRPISVSSIMEQRIQEWDSIE